MEPGVTLSFRLEGAGWASLLVEHGRATYAIRYISYLTNALDDILRLGLSLAHGTQTDFCVFEHEPGITVLVAESSWKVGANTIRGGRLSAFQHHTRDFPTKDQVRAGPRDWTVHAQSADGLARSILLAGEKVLSDHGEDGYSRLWTGFRGFPSTELRALRSALG